MEKGIEKRIDTKNGKIAGKEELEDIIMKNEIYYLDENMLFTIIPELKDCKRF